MPDNSSPNSAVPFAGAHAGSGRARLWPLVAGLLALLALLLASALIASAYSARQERAAAEGWERHTLEVIIAAERLVASLADAQRGTRGFLLTDDPAFLEPYESGPERTAAELARLRQLTRDNPAQQDRLAELTELNTLQLAFYSRTVELARTGRMEQAIGMMRSGEGLRQLAAATDLANAVVAEEERLLTVRTQAADEAAHRADLYNTALWALTGALLLGALSAGTLAVRVVQRARSAAAAAEANLRVAEVEERYRLIVEGAGDFAIIGLDDRGTITSWNSGACSIIGLSADEVLGQSGEIIFTPEDRAARVPAQELGTAATAGRAVDERWHLRADGSRFWGSGLLIRLPTGGFVKIFRDRTAERKTELAVQRSGALIEAVGAAVPDLVYAKDRQGRMLYANPATLALIGKPAEAVLGRADPDWAADRAEGEAIHATDRRIMDAGRTEVVEEVYTDTQGHQRLFRSTKAPLRDGAGVVIGLAGVTTDVTAAREADEALHASESRFRSLAGTIPALVFLADADGANTWTNTTFQQFTGRTAEELNGSGWIEALHPDDRERASVTWAKAWQTGTGYEAEYRFKHHADGHRWHMARGTPVRDASGQVVQWVGACIDIQEAVDAREALAATNADLEARVVARTAELARTIEQLQAEVSERKSAEAQVRQLQKMEAVGQLTGGIAHDFNNMLAIVIGSLDMAKRRHGDPARLQTLIENAEEGARRAAQLTARLLAFSRQQALEPEVVDANKLVGGMSELLRRTLGEEIRVETVLAGGLWKCFVDAGQVENALVNLCVNARDAMPSGGRLTIETANSHLDDGYAAEHAEVTPGQYVVLCVTDTGTGMPPQVVERAFDPFYTTKGTGKGTGLGLSQVYGFVKQSGGHVKIYSEPNQGTTVKLYLPRFYGEEEAAAAKRTQMAEALPRARDAEVVLVVEDEAGVRHLSVDALRELGYTVVQASDADQALSVLQLQPRVDLLFTDIVMPGQNGRLLADEARRRRPDLRVLFTTGYTRNAVVHNGMLDPGVAFLPKPFTIQALAQKVRAVLDGEGINRPLPPGRPGGVTPNAGPGDE